MTGAVIALGHPPRPLLLTGAIAAVLLIAAGLIDARTVLAFYLPAAVAVASLSIGCLGLMLMMHVMDGRWRTLLFRPVSAGVRALPVAGLLMLPVALGASRFYPWMGADHGDWTAFKTFYLTPAFFAARTIVYFGLWIFLGGRMLHRPYPQRATAGVGLIVFTLTASLAGVDWLMTLEPDFSSSIFGLIVLAHMMLAAMAAVILARAMMRAAKAAEHEKSGALGALLLCVLLVWAYMHAMQFIIIWSADRPDEIAWYIARSSGIWCVMLWLLGLGFLGLFGALLSSAARASDRAMAVIARIVLAAGVVEVYWLARPAFEHTNGILGAAALVLSIAATAALWLAAFVPALAHASQEEPHA